MKFSPVTFGLEGAKEKKEKLVDDLVNLKLKGKMPETVFKKILETLNRANKD